jgi:hypothetical protein
VTNLQNSHHPLLSQLAGRKIEKLPLNQTRKSIGQPKPMQSVVCLQKQPTRKEEIQANLDVEAGVEAVAAKEVN